MSALLSLIILIIVFGVLMWIINTYIPMPAAIKSLLNIVVVVVLVLYVLQFFGLITTLLPPILIR